MNSTSLEWRVEIYPTLQSVSPSQWRALFQGYPMSPETIWLIEKSGFEDFSSNSIVVWHGDTPVIYLPLFLTEFPLEGTQLPEWQRRLVRLTEKINRRWVYPKGVAVGFLEAHGGAVGVMPDLPPETLEKAWKIALKKLYSYTRETGSDIVVFFDFSEAEMQKLPDVVLKDYGKWNSLPYAVMKIQHGDVEEFIASLSKKTRENLRQKRRKSPAVSIIHTRTPAKWLNKIYDLYLATALKSNWQMGIHEPEFFEKICETEPHAEYTLYVDEFSAELIAFTLSFVYPEYFIYYDFGMDQEIGKDYNIYFTVWLENVRYCIEKNIPYYYAGNTLEHQKRRLGAELIPATTLYKHQHPIGQKLFRSCENNLNYHSKDPLS